MKKRIKLIKIIVTAVLLLPTAFFLLFMFGEVFGGDISGLSHLLQAAPFILAIILIWKLPLKKKK